MLINAILIDFVVLCWSRNILLEKGIGHVHDSHQPFPSMAKVPIIFKGTSSCFSLWIILLSQ